jgi:hypothetical protein
MRDAVLPETPFGCRTDSFEKNEGGGQHVDALIVALISPVKQARVRDWSGFSMVCSVESEYLVVG